MKITCRGIDVLVDAPWDLGTQRSGNFQLHKFTATNPSTTETLHLTGVPRRVDVSDSGGFLSVSEFDDLPVGLAPGSSKDFWITFDASGATPGSTVEGAVKIPLQRSGEPPSTFEFKISIDVTNVDVPDINVRRQGAATIPHAPAIGIDFGDLAAATQSAPLTVAIENIGEAPLTVTGISIADPVDFALVFPAVPFAINPGLTETFQLVFKPQVPGTFSGVAVTITSDDPDVDEQQSVFLVGGNGIASAPAAPSGLRVKP